MIIRLIPNKSNIKGIAIFPFIFVRKNFTKDDVLINHEKIHLRQQLELLIIPFYIIYLVEWIFKGYYGISFEKETYENQTDLDYLKKRRYYEQWRR